MKKEIPPATPAITCYLAVPVKTDKYPGADEEHLKEVFAHMKKYYAPAEPFGRSWLIREGGSAAILGTVVGKGYAVQVNLIRNHRRDLRMAGAIITTKEPKDRPVLQVTPSRRDRSTEKARGWQTKAEVAAVAATSTTSKAFNDATESLASEIPVPIIIPAEAPLNAKAAEAPAALESPSLASTAPAP